VEKHFVEAMQKVEQISKQTNPRERNE